VSINLAILTLSFAALAAAADPAPVFSFVKKNCVACHNAKITNGDVNLAALDSSKSFDESRETWEKTVEKLKTGQMPPPGLPKPPAAETAAVTRFLEAEFHRQDSTAKPDPGRVTARRLNRSEYNNTIRDLLGVDIRPADNFPNDESAYGFDNIGDALTLSPVLLEKYLYAAERSVRTAIFGPEKLKPAMIHYPLPVRINDDVRNPSLPKDLFHYDQTGLSSRHSAHVMHRFPVDGEYSFRLVLNGHRPNGAEPVHPALFIDGRKVQEWEVDATDLEGQIVEARMQVTAGDHLLSTTYLNNYHGLPAKYGGPDPSKRPSEPLITVRGKLTEKDIETLRKYGTKIKTDRIETRVDNRWESIDVGGPFRQTEGPSPGSVKAVFVCRQETAACAQTIIASFARRAFRRPVTAAETGQFVKLYTLARQQGDGFKEGIATALQGVLVSPNFLFRIERDRPGQFAPVSSYELASRLSYFLWSSMPDEALMTAAAQGSLGQPTGLAAQVRRMLRDPKSRALVDNFAGQWLQFKNIDVMKPDIEKFPEFEDFLRYSMRRETELFLENLIREDASVLEILDSKHTYLNERLARFYGIAGVTGPEFRRVDMSKTERGGGVLAQASVLTISSYSTRTSPVLRGKWILENLLNAPPPAPPAAVPALDESKVGESASLRQQMEAHRKNPACASCHSRMDPLGFGLENLNAIGSWRTMDGKFPVDASGELPGGRKFQGPVELKTQLMEDKDAFVRALTTKLLTYALGRGLERYDRPVVASISSRLPAKNYRFSALVLDIASSLPFQQRRPALVSRSASPQSGEKSE
jgi:cytochrome c551/c552